MITKWENIFLLILATLIVVNATEKSSNLKNNATSQEELKLIDYRLPTSIRPINYELKINILPALSFRGSVKIKVIVQEKTDKIVLHYGKLNITGVSVLNKLKQLTIKSKNYDPLTEKYSITLKDALQKKAEITIAIVYSGEAHNDLRGFYEMNYFNKKGEAKKMAATQFSPIYARHAFPCFDEPAFKASFKIKIQRPSNYIALSNMPLSSSKKVTASIQQDVFEESVKMSTYLVGFVIGELKSTSKGIIKLWSRQDVTNQVDYSLKLATEILQELSFFFELPYQLNKLDMVALPEMYFTAMENWGLITYRESALLYDKKDSSVLVQKTVAETIAHECTHMWFGNIVTPDWWGYLWLKEAFAGYYEFRSIDTIEPTWKMKEQILLKQQNALFLDFLPLSKPLSRDVHSPEEILGMFDRISYDKGLSILRMMDLSFGTEVFDSALLLYLQSRENKTSKPENLFASMQMKINSDLDASVETIMNSWTKQSGYPVLSVTVDKNRVTLKQKPFSLEKTNTTVNKKWWIPISWTTKLTSSPHITINRWINDDEIITVDKNEDEWIIFNVQAAGFYRVNYDTASWHKIIKALKEDKFTNIPEPNRAAIIDDLLNLARANLVDYAITLEGLQYLKQETNYLPFKAAFNSLDYLTRKLSGQPEFDLYSRYLLRLVKNIHSKLGFYDKNNDDMTTMLLRRELNWISCYLDHQDCVDKSLRYFYKWKNGDNARVPRNLKTVVYAMAIKNGNPEDWDFLWNKYDATNIVSEQMEIFNALLCSQNSEVLNKHLRSFLFDANKHRMYHQKLKDVFNSVLSCSLFGTELVLNFIDLHFKEILKFSGNDLEQISSILLQVSQYLSTQTLIDKFEALMQSHSIDLEPIISSLKVQLDFAKYDLKLYHQNSKKIVNWLKTDDDKLKYSENVNYIISE